MKKLVLIDAHAVIHRAYHALPPLTSPKGEAAGAVYGFVSILLKILREFKPDYIAAAFDLPVPTFRHIAYERYKAHRPETPAELSAQFVKIKKALEVFAIPVFERGGYEADDVIGTIADKIKPKDAEIIVVSGDLDVLQLARPGLKVYYMRKGISDFAVYDEEAVAQKFGFGPSCFADFKGIRGDPSDNIPGVKGIGEKNASFLVKTFGTLERIYEALEKNDKRISASLGAKLRAGREDAFLSRDLAVISRSVPIKIDLSSLYFRVADAEKISLFFQELGFASLLKRFREQYGFVSDGGKFSKYPEAAQSAEEIKEEKEFVEFVKISSGGKFGFIVDGGDFFIVKPALPDGSGCLARKIERNLFSRRAVKNFFAGGGDFRVYDGKSAIHFLRSFGIEPAAFKFDLMLAAYLAGGFSRNFSYAAIVGRETGIADGAETAAGLLRFFETADSLERKLKESGAGKIFSEIEMPLVRILADMEERGIKLNADLLKELGDEVGGRLGVLTEEIYALAGGKFNINSPRQLSEILFGRLKIRSEGLRKTEKERRISTGASELEKLKKTHPLAQKILDYRELMKLKTTYLDALPKLVDAETGRLHTVFNQTGTATGRLSSAEPNLQNIPATSDYGQRIRRAFVAESGFILVSFDYSQIELRLAAHIADDGKMIDFFRRGFDVHRLTAAEIYNVAPEKVAPELRRSAKVLNFGVLYGMGAQAFSEAAGISRAEAQKYIDEYFRDFSGIRNYVAEAKSAAEEKGYAETIWGRRRYLPEINSSNWQIRREAERMAVNAPIQGSAADLVKMAMIKIDDMAKKNNLGEKVRLLLQVHDELLFEIKKSSAAVVPEIKKIMEEIVELKVPLVVEAKGGENWGEQPLKW